jgi:16S rRNA (guanine527-N7)-methyltransferase
VTIYLRLLARWNRKINLTSLKVDPPDEDAVDRLVIEPLKAATHLPAGNALIVDVGSGGGSPAVPLKLALEPVRLVMVESVGRKAAFLRDVVRELRLTGTSVEDCRFEAFAATPANQATADAVTLRAVRVDDALTRAVRQVIKPGGGFVRFGTREELERAAPGELFEVLDGRNAWVSVTRTK